jgi:hypothetical protein
MYQKRDLPSRIKRKLHAIGGSRGVWSLSVRPGSRPYSTTAGRSGILPDDDSIIVSTDATPAPGLSRVCYDETMLSTPTDSIQMASRSLKTELAHWCGIVLPENSYPASDYERPASPGDRYILLIFFRSEYFLTICRWDRTSSNKGYGWKYDAPED